MSKEQLSEELKPIVLTQVREGKSVDEILSYLKNQYDIQLSIRTMTKFLKNSREMRQEVAKEQYALAVSDSAHTDLNTISVVLADLNLLFLETINKQKVYESVACARTMLEYIKFRASLSGILNAQQDVVVVNGTTTTTTVTAPTHEQMSRQTEDIVAGLLEKLGK